MTTHQLIDTVVAKIVHEVNPHRIYLFGSHGRGDASIDSDIDLLIVADMPGDRRERNRAVRRLFPKRAFALDVFVFQPDEFERQKKLLSSLSYVAATEGRVVYERT